MNKFLYPRAGAETAFFHTRDLLSARGHRVIEFGMQDPQNVPSSQAAFLSVSRTYTGGGARNWARRGRDAGASIYSLSARRAISRLLDHERPEIAHLHNIYHQLTFSIVDELAARGVPMVQTLHDWKIACPSYNLFTQDAPCRRCIDTNVLSAVKHRCVKGSRAASAVAAIEAALAHKRRSYDRIQRFIAPSIFARSVAQAAGVSQSRVDVLPYLVPYSEMGSKDDEGFREPVFFHGGRLDNTKGVRQLLAAFALVPPPARLEIAGWGDLEPEVEAAARGNPRIEFLGRLSRDQVLERLARSRALVLPSIWEDNCPLVMLEAQARSTPVVVSDRGGPPEFVVDGEHGFVVDPTDIGALAARIDHIARNPALAAAMGRRGHERLIAEHGSDEHYRRLMEVYDRTSGDAAH